MNTGKTLLQAQHLRKYYNNVTALHDASIELKAGSIHGLVGENGSGKSTLVRLLAGIEPYDKGSITYGNPHMQSAVVPQHPAMAAELTLWQNITAVLNTQNGMLISRSSAVRTICRIQHLYNTSVNLQKKAKDCSTTELRMASLLAALCKEPDILVLDEPTVGMTTETQHMIHNILQSFISAQNCILYISHDLQEVCSLAHVIFPLQTGKTLQCTYASHNKPIDPLSLAAQLFHAAASTPEKSISMHNTRADTGKMQTEPAQSSETEKEKRYIHFKDCVLQDNTLNRRLGPLNFHVYGGSITAVTGIWESGIDILENYFMGEACIESGTAVMDDTQPLPVQVKNTHKAQITCIPHKRIEHTTARYVSVEDNAVLAEYRKFYQFGIKARAKIQRFTHRILNRFGSISTHLRSPLHTLSGGSIHKLILSRELNIPSMLYIISEPTAGLDIKSQELLFRSLHRIAETGSAVLLLTSSLSEAMRASQIIVLYNDTLYGVYTAQQEQKIIHAFAGITGNIT